SKRVRFDQSGYEKIRVYSSLSQIFQLLLNTSTITLSTLQEFIATKIVIAMVHPNATADPSDLDPVKNQAICYNNKT
ncbi:unnamed protein product, partial [Rotaria socialis]